MSTVASSLWLVGIDWLAAPAFRNDARPVAQRYSGYGLACTPDSPRSCRRAELLRGRGSRTDSGRRAADGRVRDPTRSRSAPPARRLPSPAPPPKQRIAAILNAAVECRRFKRTHDSVCMTRERVRQRSGTTPLRQRGCFGSCGVPSRPPRRSSGLRAMKASKLS